MDPHFFSLETPRDLYNKAVRERERMRSDPHIDNVYNFFVTIRHLPDYIKRNSTVAQRLINSLESGDVIKACRDVGDKAKHLVLTGSTQKPRDDVQARVKGYTAFTAPFGTVPFNSIQTVWELRVDGKIFDVFRLADEALEIWGRFLGENGL
ncbi:hypothetical protein [Burkholderia singularis]|uniref:hypothetical protein n=1 Tax=Burkholderia singularis TaxID=1503053 RepID=UPI000B7893D8|nr:hypothetical protein [Burkholderia singularis]